MMPLPDSITVRHIHILFTFALSPAANMGIDEWLASQAALYPGQLFARLYSWSPGGITIGFHQNIATALQAARLGDDLVIRRVTGGRAVYHDPSEFTYAFACKSDEPQFVKTFFSLGVRRILVSFLEQTGGIARSTGVSDPDDQAPLSTVKSACFASHTRDELVLPDGSKLVARARRQDGPLFFEHGSIKLNGIASHPALSITSSKSNLPPLSQASFELMSIHFEAATGAFWESIAPNGIDSLESKVRVLNSQEVLERADHFVQLIQRNPLGRRPLGKRPF